MSQPRTSPSRIMKAAAASEAMPPPTREALLPGVSEPTPSVAGTLLGDDMNSCLWVGGTAWREDMPAAEKTVRLASMSAGGSSPCAEERSYLHGCAC